MVRGALNFIPRIVARSPIDSSVAHAWSHFSTIAPPGAGHPSSVEDVRLRDERSNPCAKPLKPTFDGSWLLPSSCERSAAASELTSELRRLRPPAALAGFVPGRTGPVGFVGTAAVCVDASVPWVGSPTGTSVPRSSLRTCPREAAAASV